MTKLRGHVTVIGERSVRQIDDSERYEVKLVNVEARSIVNCVLDGLVH